VAQLVEQTLCTSDKGGEAGDLTQRTTDRGDNLTPPCRASQITF
jgi:hypothetical protein